MWADGFFVEPEEPYSLAESFGELRAKPWCSAERLVVEVEVCVVVHDRSLARSQSLEQDWVDLIFRPVKAAHGFGDDLGFDLAFSVERAQGGDYDGGSIDLEVPS